MRYFSIFILLIFTGLVFIQCQTEGKKNITDAQVPPQQIPEEPEIPQEKVIPCINPLVEACKKNNIDEINKLIDDGCDVNDTKSIKDNYLVSPLWYASGRQDTTALIKLIASGADPNLDLGDNYSPLTYAASFSPQAVRLLIEFGADVNFFNENAVIQTPLIAAIRSNGMKQLKLLVENGARTNFKDVRSEKQIEDPLHAAISRQFVEITKYLLQNGADPNIKITDAYEDCTMCPDQIAPIHTAASSSGDPARAIRLIDLLDEADSDLLARNRFGQNALDYIATSGDAQVAEHLIKKGLPISDSTVVSAAMYQNEEFLKVIMKYGGNPNAQAYNGSAIHHALNCCGDGFNDRPLSDRKKTVQILLDNGAIADDIILEMTKEAGK